MLRATAPTVLLAIVAACASGAGPDGLRRPEVRWSELWPELAQPGAAVGGDGAFPARRPDAAGLERLRAAEQLWRAKDAAGFAAARDALCAEPLLAFWLARMLIRDTLFLRERARADTGALVGAPPWQPPFDELVAMGVAAAPCVVLDLLRQRAVDRRDLGAEVLRAMGPGALPAWERTLDVADPLVRRYAVHALGGSGGDPRARSRLLAATADPDFGVRAEAWRGLAAGSDAEGERLRAALAAEGDPFVRRAIVEGLGRQPDEASAAALVGYLEEAVAARDADGIEAANLALRAWSGRAENDSAAGWQRWLQDRARGDG